MEFIAGVQQALDMPVQLNKRQEILANNLILVSHGT